jgi:hypothetical protein
MRKTRLRRLADSYGDKECVLAPASIDPVIYMMAELGESSFGHTFIDLVWDDIQLTNGNFPRKKSLEIISNIFFKDLMQAFENVGKMKQDEYAKKMRELPPLDDNTYVDYFVLFITVDQHVSNTVLQKACPNIQAILTAYQTESPGAFCEGIVTFYRETENVLGYMKAIKKLCDTIKGSD